MRGWSRLLLPIVTAVGVGAGYMLAGGELLALPVVLVASLLIATALLWLVRALPLRPPPDTDGEAAVRRLVPIYAIVLVVGVIASFAAADGIPVFALALLAWPGIAFYWVAARRRRNES